MPDQKTVEICKKLISRDLGKISILPVELKNTICNIYYHEIKKHNDEANVNSDFPEDFSSEKTELLQRMIKSYLEISKTEGKRESDFISKLIVDEMKFGIRQAHRYSEISRFIKRFIRRKKVCEIDNLYEYIV